MKTSPKSKDTTGFKSSVKLDSSSLHDLFYEGIKDIYWAENHIIKSLPKMISAATSTPLQDALTEHLKVTKKQVVRLETTFELLGQKKQAKKCDALEGIAKEGEGIVEDTLEGTTTRDIGIIMASQKVENYEICAYKGLIKLSNKLGLSEISKLLNQSLIEEQKSDELLASIADKELANIS
jgi:ferritin-like metal-binding protein YciE